MFAAKLLALLLGEIFRIVFAEVTTAVCRRFGATLFLFANDNDFSQRLAAVGLLALCPTYRGKCDFSHRCRALARWLASLAVTVERSDFAARISAGCGSHRGQVG